jgi:hypothetical protein
VFSAPYEKKIKSLRSRYDKACASAGFVVFLGCAELAVPRQKSCDSILSNYPRLSLFVTGISKGMALALTSQARILI